MSVSVILPTFNRETTLLRSINSVLRQSHVNLELIIVDDASSDGSSQLIANIRDDRIVYRRLDERSGACFARNIGVAHSKHNVIAFQDSDDVWHVDKLKQQIKFLLENKLDVCGGLYNQFIDGAFTQMLPSLPGRARLSLENYILQQNWLSTPTMLGRKNCFAEQQFDTNLPRFQDWELAIRLSRKYRVGVLDQPVVDAYVQGDSISCNPHKAMIALQYIQVKHRELFEDDDKANSLLYRRLYHYSLISGDAKLNYLWKSLRCQFSWRTAISLAGAVAGLDLALKNRISKKQ